MHLVDHASVVSSDSAAWTALARASLVHGFVSQVSPLRIANSTRSVGAYPLNFMEYYFPLRLAVDSTIGGYPGLVHTDGVSMRPVIDIKAGESPMLGNPPAGSPVIPGYHHLDVLTAAPVQNDGQPEKVVTELLKFIFQ